ncbi:MAG: motility protein A [Candidatus Cloacimonetes bacterium]|jgi:chemotaxis protein MotA|nr:motility protein A [Candidatus Cloacimonadota bacterium]MDD4155597.1 motility protein A [Candidatus Cloacimonadota bacterium]
MDIATFLGIIFAFALVFVPLILKGDLPTFIDYPSLMITIGGAVSATIASFTMNDIIGSFKVTKNAFFSKPQEPGKIIDSMVDLGEKARREGILALEREMAKIDDDFLKKSIQLAVDGNEPEVIENVMSTEIDNLEERHKTGKSIFDTLANFGPAFGMIGTLIGLIQMLKSLDDPSNIGAGMAVALITTFYGSMLANAVATPIANKLGVRSKEEINIKNMILFGVLSIHSGDNPRVTRDKLETFISPNLRKGSS